MLLTLVYFEVIGFVEFEVWAYEAVPEIGERFGQRVGERMPRLLRWSARKQPQHRTYDAFFKNVRLHVYATLRPTDAEAEQQYFSTLVLGNGGQLVRQEFDDGVSSGGSGEDETSGDECVDTEESGEGASERSSVGADTCRGQTGASSTPPAIHVSSPVRGPTMETRPVGTSGSGLTKEEVEELLFDQRILFEMRLRTVKLEIKQHVTSECKKLELSLLPSWPHLLRLPLQPRCPPIPRLEFQVVFRKKYMEEKWSLPWTSETCEQIQELHMYKDTGLMEFDYCIQEEARLRAHISQRSNLKYVKTVMDVFDDRQRDEFRNSPFGYLAELVFRTIRTDKVNELWFNVQGNMMRFGLQEYILVTGLRCGVFPEGDEFDRVLERRRLKERVGYRCLLHGFRGFWAKKFLKAKRRQEKEVTYTIHGFPIAMQVWAYEAVPEIGERFGQRVGEQMPRLLRWSARKQPQHRTYDTFFKNVRLHVYATLRPIDAEAEQQYFSTLVPYDDPPVPVLDEIARNVVGPHFNASHGGSESGGQLVRQESDDGVSSGGGGEDDTSGDEGADAEESGEGASERSSVGADTCRG
ncbi:Hypothetical predicted protein [Olea europaea subsp. europaea]|uniref:DUF1985 domain-containing protein n=1 Tax=Olea europaea subsp. europaea TaxID=158383 RepID=A0A8S0STQ7_OLEEU|nr:Hypothetical predicted protein [Olea europaea subsp. europaea]